jgi:hypothetical protein
MSKRASARRSDEKVGNVLIPAAVGKDKTALVPSNPRVANIAFRLRWNAETVIRRVENTLTSPIEQQLYLRVAGGYRIHPESLLKLLEIFRGARELQACDLEQVSLGKNLATSRFDDILEKVEHALVILDKTSDNAEYHVSMRTAALLVEAYGEHSMEVFGELMENVAQVAELLGIHSTSDQKIVAIAVKILVEEVLQDRIGLLPLTIEEMFGDRRKRRE